MAILDHLGIERAAAGGSSMGSAVSVATGLRHPDRAAALVLNGSVFAGNEVGFLPSQGDINARHQRMMEQIETGAVPAGGVQAQRLASSDPKSLVASLRAMQRIGHPFERLDDLRLLTMPVRVIPGSDPVHAREVSGMHLEMLPNGVRPDLGVAIPDTASEEGRAEIQRMIADGDFAKIVDGMQRTIREFLRSAMGVRGAEPGL